MIYKSKNGTGLNGSRLFEMAPGIPIDEIKQLENWAGAVTKNAIIGNAGQYLFDLRKYVPQKYAQVKCQQIIRRYIDIATKVNTKATAPFTNVSGFKSDMLTMLSMYFLETGVCYVLDIEKMDGALYTRCEQVLRKEIRCPDAKKVDDRCKQLYGTTTFNKLAEGKIWACRLEILGTGEDYGFSPVGTQKGLDVHNHVVIPVCMMYAIGDVFNSFVSKGAAKFVKSNEHGTFTNIITANKDIVRQVYQGLARGQAVEEKLRTMDEPGFDVVQCRYAAYDLEAPVDYTKMATFKYERLDTFVKAAPKDINRDLHTLDSQGIKLAYLEHIQHSVNEDNMGTVDWIDRKLVEAKLEKNPGYEVECVKDVASQWGKETSAKAVYNVMTTHPAIFGNESTIAATIKMTLSEQPQISQDFKEIYKTDIITPDMGSSSEEIQIGIAEKLTEMAKTGVLKIIARSGSSGHLYEVKGTLNHDILVQYWGSEQALMKVESPRNKIKKALELMDSGVDEIRACSDCNLHNLVMDSQGDIRGKLTAELNRLEAREKGTGKPGVHLKSVDKTAKTFNNKVTITTIEKIFYAQG